MSEYQVQRGDTIARVTQQLNTNWETLSKNNPNAIGRSSKNGNWFLKEGAILNTENSFATTLQRAEQHKEFVKPSASSAFTDNTPIIPETPFVPEASQKSHNRSGKIVEHTIQPGDTIWELAVKKYHVHIKDVMADNGINDPKTLQIGQTLKIQLPGSTGEKPVVASWYGEKYHGKPMANGDIYDMHAATIAHKEMPLGTRVELKNSITGEKVLAVVTDRGPYIDGRDVDLSYGLAQKLSLVEQGVGNLVMRIL